MKESIFNALTVYTTRAAVDLLADGTAFLWGAAGTRLTPNVHGQQQGNTAIRHKISYYVKDTSDIGFHPVFDVLEADLGTQLSKTDVKRNRTSVAARDDDDRRDYIALPDWS